MIYNPYPARLIYPNRRTLEEGQKAQKARGTSPSKSRRTFFPMRKRNRY
jgi:hypothetical protein